MAPRKRTSKIGQDGGKPQTTRPVASPPDPDRIAALAYFLWEAEGRPDGRDAAHWLEAEARLRAAESPDEPALASGDVAKLDQDFSPQPFEQGGSSSTRQAPDSPR